MKNKKIIISIIATVLAIAIITVIAFILIKNNKKYTITFDTQGGNKIEAVTVKVNETAVLPKNPEKEGYIFLHWVDEENKIVSGNFKVTRDRKLTAKWAEPTQEVITVSFDTDGGTEIEDILLIKGETLKLPDNPTKEGYIFKNWVDKNETPIYEDVLLAEDTVLKAIWEKEEEKKARSEGSATRARASSTADAFPTRRWRRW